jgi:hypothetical protein
MVRYPDDLTILDFAKYAKLRAASTHPASRFDALASEIVRDLSDGEDWTAEHWLSAARILVSGQVTT